MVGMEKETERTETVVINRDLLAFIVSGSDGGGSFITQGVPASTQNSHSVVVVVEELKWPRISIGKLFGPKIFAIISMLANSVFPPSGTKAPR